MYPATTGGTVHYDQASGTFPANQTTTYTAAFDAIDNTHNYAGLGVFDSAHNAYILAMLESSYGGSGGGGFGILKVPASGCGSSFTSVAHSSTFTPSGVYNVTWTISSNGATVSMTVVVTQSSTTIWSSGTITDTSYPGVNSVGIYTANQGVSGAGFEIGNLSATYTGGSMSISPSSAPASSTGNVLTVTGSGTNWVSGTTTFAASAGTITATTIHSGTSATLTYTAPSSGSSVTFSDSSDSATGTISLVTASMSVSPALVQAGSTGNALTVTGTNTNWVSGTTTFSASAGTITGTTITSATSATLTYTAPASSNAVTISDSSDAAAGTVTTYLPPTNAGFYFSPGSWYLSGSSYAVANSAGAYFYLSFTGTSATLLLNTSNLGANPLYVRVIVDGGAYADTNIQGLSSLTLGSGLANTAHNITVIYRARTINVDAWNTPSDGLVVTGVQLSSGAATTAPAHLAKTCLIVGDSIVEAYNVLGNAGTAAVQDVTYSAAEAMAQALGCEFAMAAWSGQGWDTTGNGNIPVLGSTWNYIYSGVPRNVSGYNYIIDADMGTNDYSHSVPASTVTTLVASWLSAVRTANATAKIIVIPPWNGEFASAVLAGFNNYQTATPDANAFYVTPGLTAAQVAAINYCSGSSYISYDCLHPNAWGQETVAAGLVGNLKTATTAAPFAVLGKF
jgi:hypothetical protein